jgi:LysR family transcriptional regulator, transcriptional activator of the cysJI operon
VKYRYFIFTISFFNDRSGEVDFEALRTFIAVVEEKNFTRAGEKRLLSQPSISLHVKNLENDLGTKLIDRSPKYIRITPAGELLYRRAKQIMELYDKTHEDIYALQHRLTGTLKIGASYTIGEYVLPKIMAEFHKHYPDIYLEISVHNTEKVAQSVRLLQQDIGLIEGNIDTADLKVSPFMEDEMLLVGAKDYIDENTCLQDATWITREKGSGTREFMEHFFRSHGITPKNIITISSNQGVKEAVVQKLGLSVLSHWVVRQEVLAGTLSILPMKNKITRVFSHVSPNSIEPSRAVQVFLSTLKV